MTTPLSREVALRIGLAARALPDIDPRTLIGYLVDGVGHPLTEQKLASLTVKQLKTAADGELDNVAQESLKLAIHHLNGDAVSDANALPTVQAYQEGELPNSIRIACASNTGECLDGHFGSCARFLIYQVSKEDIRLIDIRPTTGDREAEDKNTFRAQLISDCQLLYVVSIGGPAAAKVVRVGAHPIRVADGGQAQDTLQKLREILGNSPPPWLAKIMGASAEERIRFAMEAAENDA